MGRKIRVCRVAAGRNDMRAMITVTASLLICIGLLGCNRNQQVQAPLPAPVVAAAPACNCPQQVAATAPVVRRIHRHRHHAWREHESSSYSQSQEAESSYSSSSDSASEYDGAAESEQSASEPQAVAWIDGYGRSHYGSASASEDSNPAALAPADVHRRLAPWHAFNADCDRAQ